MENDIDYRDILREIFPDRAQAHIENVIQIVEENFPDDDYKLEEMINLLTESGQSTLCNSNDDYQDEATGFGQTFTGDYYVARGDQTNSIYEQLVDMIPDADPDYLREQSELLAERPSSELQTFIENAIEKHDYPTKREYFKRQKNITELKRYTYNFSVEDFLITIPDPVEYFNSSYKSVLTDDDVSEEDETYAVNCLINLFPYLRVKDIKKVFNRYNKNIIKASDTLARIPRHFKTPRVDVEIFDVSENIKLLQEIAFITHKQEIKTAMKMKNHLYRLARAEAEEYNLLETCQCCFFDGLLPEECYFCQKNCAFCKECVAKGAEHVIGKGELVFPCLSNCNGVFEITTLRMVLDPKVFEPLFKKIQIEEVKKANIDGLETCPFCDFSLIISSNEEKIFKCQNVECMEESCRECRHKSHVPLKCNEIEYDEDVKKRTYIENKMTEALLRTCLTCKKSFLKESGCNKMTCPCGAKMCYVCGASNIDYNHFGEIRNNKCPLYTSDLKTFHANRVIMSAKEAKAELGINNNPGLLKIDPTEGLEEYFQTL